MLRKKTRPISCAPSLTPSLELDLPPPTLEIEWARSTPSLDLSGISRSLSRLRKSSIPRGSKPPPASTVAKEDLGVIPETPNGHQLDFSKPARYSGPPVEIVPTHPPAPAPTSPTSLNSWVHVQATSPTAYQPMSPSSPTTPVMSPTQVTPPLGTTPISNYYTKNNTSLDFSRVQSFPMPPERAILKLPSVSDIQLPDKWDIDDGRKSEFLDSSLPNRTSSLGHGPLLSPTSQGHLDVSIPMGRDYLSPSGHGHSPSDVESVESSVSTSDNYFSTVSTGTHRTFGQGPPPHTFERVETCSPYYRPEANASTFSLQHRPPGPYPTTRLFYPASSILPARHCQERASVDAVPGFPSSPPPRSGRAQHVPSPQAIDQRPADLGAPGLAQDCVFPALAVVGAPTTASLQA
ncbi:hypothetical protein A1Q1_02411 [Trichosporon asahii var. asahii CBS 2479]|uniref:Uncharacterized protein n=1 Tax=Trichosporon asahii var. asahii (strain ATCC 90039 / CBS 2479 / JCM 2466 / KCTC 7840 / NBRC 103889/ NCYC 2677 / UAMH 7654) TaxID=1186058 RepID=J6EVG2_TRIAS|nr:hypothetical protein A1Q1_02411 [Trichosporon asahii var. asahii CBS 2479]EJT48574.1 hypothetical protein A1Q1_02411 [Trichosporon asahii var. asahii CBS 2479]